MYAGLQKINKKISLFTDYLILLKMKNVFLQIKRTLLFWMMLFFKVAEQPEIVKIFT